MSTDSKEIISISKKYKIHAPFIRPVKYSRDNSSVYDVIKHCAIIFIGGTLLAIHTKVLIQSIFKLLPKDKEGRLNV